MIPDLIIVKKFAPPRLANLIVGVSIKRLCFFKLIYKVGVFIIGQMYFFSFRNIAVDCAFFAELFVRACIFVENNIDHIDYPPDC